jgi:hypothetical protein
MLSDEFAEAQTLVQLAHQKQTTIRRDWRSLEIDLQGSIGRKPEGLVLFLTHRVLIS